MFRVENSLGTFYTEGFELEPPHYQQLSTDFPLWLLLVDTKWMMFISKDEGKTRNETILCSVLTPPFSTSVRLHLLLYYCLPSDTIWGKKPADIFIVLLRLKNGLDKVVQQFETQKHIWEPVEANG